MYFDHFDSDLSKKLISKFLHFNQRSLYKAKSQNDTKQKNRPGKLRFRGDFGGNMWESNPPGRFLAPLTGFEDRGAHQHPATPMGNHCNTAFSKMQALFWNLSKKAIIPGIPPDTAGRRPSW